MSINILWLFVTPRVFCILQIFYPMASLLLLSNDIWSYAMKYFKRSKKSKNTLFQYLQGEVLFEIFKYINIKHLLNKIVYVCKEWSTVVHKCVNKLELQSEYVQFHTSENLIATVSKYVNLTSLSISGYTHFGIYHLWELLRWVWLSKVDYQKDVVIWKN